MKLSGLILLSTLIISGCAATPAAKNKAKLQAYDYRIKTANGKCLQHNTTKHTLSAASCSKHDTQRFAVAGNDIRVNGLCLQAASGKTNKTHTVTAAQCTDQPNQNWYRDGQTIRSSLNGLCLDAAKSNTLRLSRCNHSQAQQFSFSH